MERLLLHTCCAPCSASAISAITLLTDFKIVSFWYNPNIYPLKENNLRYETWKKFMHIQGIKTIEQMSEWHENESLYEELWLDNAIKCDRGRCYYCYLKRLEKTAEAAKKNGIKNFSTTLLSSPYQKHDIIKETAREIAQKNKLNFIYVDPRKLYYVGVNTVKYMSLYSQKYCGCKISNNDI